MLRVLGVAVFYWFVACESEMRIIIKERWKEREKVVDVE